MDHPVASSLRLPAVANYSCVPLSPKCVAAMHEAILTSGDALKRWNTWWHPDSVVSETAAFIEREAGHVGSCALSSVDRETGKANLSYWTRSDHTGRGIASAAARSIAAWGVRELGLARIEVAMATANVASRHVAERSGAVFEGMLRNRVKVHGRLHNYALYAFTPEDFHEDEPSVAVA